MNTKKLVLLSISVFVFLLSFKEFDLEKLTAFNSHGEEAYKVYALKLPISMEFSDEAVPLDQPDIRERLDKELLVNTYWQSNMMLLLKRANKYFPSIEKILEEEGVPDDFKYLAVIESALENVRSPKGATGC